MHFALVLYIISNGSNTNEYLAINFLFITQVWNENWNTAAMQQIAHVMHGMHFNGFWKTNNYIHLLSPYTMHAPCTGSYLRFKQTITPDSGEMCPHFVSCIYRDPRTILDLEIVITCNRKS